MAGEYPEHGRVVRYTYDEWTGAYISFVQPESDSIGIFLMGVLRHYAQTGDSSFLSAMWPAVQKAAGFITSGIASNGLARRITRSGRRPGVQLLHPGHLRGRPVGGRAAGPGRGQQLPDGHLEHAAAGIATALQRSSLSSPAGMWNAPDSYYDRAVNTDNTARVSPIDSSSDMLFVLGVIDSASSRATAHVSKITRP